MNPFDAVGNRKSKFTVLNKRAKGQVRNVGKARQMAVERRKKTLLVEYNASKKDNVFKDRRFGEDDPSLSLEEKMLLRFQKERQKRARKSGAGRFNLEHDDEADDDDDDYGGLTLTHKGKALGGDGEDDYQDKDGLASSDEEDGGHGLNKEIVKELHFGGSGPGDRKRPSPADEEGHYGPGAAKKTRAELMEEIIAKSKMHKATKAKQKDAQEVALSQLDDQFQELLGDLEFRDKYKSKKDEQARDAREKEERKAAAASALLLDEGNDYDELMNAIRDERFAAKAQDRTKTPEEIATEEKEKLKRLEAARLARMRGEVDAELKREARDGRGGGDDEEEGEEGGGSSSEEEGSDDGLGKLGQGWDADSDCEDEEEEGDSDDSSSSSSASDDEEEEEDEAHDEESGSGEEEEEEGDGEEGEEGDSSSEEGKEGTTEISPAMLHKLLALKEKERSKRMKASQEQAVEEGRPIGKVGRQKAAVAKVVARTQEGSTGINPQMPYILECPATMDHFVDLVKEYAQGPQDVAEMITRIRQYHAIRSGGDRERVHNFYDILMRRLACLGDALAPARVVEVDAISEALAAMTQEMPAVAAALWGRMLTGLQAKLAKALRDHELGQRARSTWPSPGALLLLRLLPRIFPVTDFRHPVVTPALLYMGQALSQCPVVTPTDVEGGLFVAALAVQYTEGAGRLMPEAFAFLLSLLGAMGGNARASCLPTLAPSLMTVLHQHTLNAAGAAVEGGKEGGAVGPIVLGRGKNLEEGEGEDEEEKEDRAEAVTAVLASQYLSVACRLLGRVAAGPLHKSPAARELFEPFIACLTALESIVAKKKKGGGKQGESSPPSVLALLRETKATVEGVVEEALKVRTVLSWRKKGVTAIQSLAPRIIDNFVVRKDEGMEREAARVKQLTRQVKREKKGVMRELRRDATFLDAEKVRVEREKEAARKQVVKDNTAWFEASAADFNKQVKMAKGETLRGGGSGLKRDMLGKGKKK
jgi:nucleolar protein 14